MVTGRTLNLEVSHYILLDLLLTLPPNIGAEDTDQHAGVDADGKKQDESYEEDHGDRIGPGCYDLRLVGHVVVADVEERSEGAPETGELT